MSFNSFSIGTYRKYFLFSPKSSPVNWYLHINNHLEVIFLNTYQMSKIFSFVFTYFSIQDDMTNCLIRHYILNILEVKSVNPKATGGRKGNMVSGKWYLIKNSLRTNKCTFSLLLFYTTTYANFLFSFIKIVQIWDFPKPVQLRHLLQQKFNLFAYWGYWEPYSMRTKNERSEN